MILSLIKLGVNQHDKNKQQEYKQYIDNQKLEQKNRELKIKEQDLKWVRKHINYLLSNVKNWYELPEGEAPYEIK